MTKETLTTENIKKDLKKHLFGNITGELPFLLIMPLLYLLMRSVMIKCFDPSDSFKTAFSIIFWTVCLIVVSYDLITIILCLRKTKNGDFTIASDWVVEKKSTKSGVVIGRQRVSYPRSYKLIFANSGTYNIPSGMLYQWSDLFATSAKTLYEYTDINEDFYVISVGNKKNVIVYRKKHFELKEQPQ